MPTVLPERPGREYGLCPWPRARRLHRGTRHAPVTTGAGGGLGSKHHAPGYTDLVNLGIGVPVPCPALVPLDPHGVFSKFVRQRACLCKVTALR